MESDGGADERDRHAPHGVDEDTPPADLVDLPEREDGEEEVCSGHGDADGDRVGEADHGE